MIHEGIGVVLRDPSGEFEPGEEVVMIPNTPVEEDEFIAENYLRSSKFRASGFNGFMQEYVEITPDRLVRLPQDIDRTVAAFTEIVVLVFMQLEDLIRLLIREEMLLESGGTETLDI